MVDSAAWKRIICREGKEGRGTGLRLGPNWRKSISLLPRDVITECQRWQEGVVLRINHVASASMTALVTVTSTEGLWWSNRNCDDFIQMSHTQYYKHPVSLWASIIWSWETGSWQAITWQLVSYLRQWMTRHSSPSLSIIHRIVKQIQRTPLPCRALQLYY